VTFRFDGSRRLIVVPVEVFGTVGSVILQFALDTGASVTLVNVGMLVLLGYDPALETERVQVTTGSGVEFVPRVTISKIVALARTRTDGLSTPRPHTTAQRCG
jgi:predicted aspartyl protease